MNSLSLKERFKLSRFLQGERAVNNEPLLLNQRRIFILPTLRGINFGLLIMLLTLIAFVYNNNLAYMLAFLLGSVFFITILHTYRCLAGLTVQEGLANNVFVGEAAGFGVIIDNPTPVERHSLQVSMQSTERCRLNPNSKVNVVLHELTVKRGWHPAGTVTISSTYPLGLFRAWSPIRFTVKALVYPKPAVVEIPFPETLSDKAQQGRYQKGGDDFYGLQSYQAGDSLKHLHWKAYAKGLGLFTKQYGGESAAEIWLDYDLAPGNAVEERLSHLCRWVVDAERAGIAYGFRLPGVRMQPGNGREHYQKCLEALALF